MKLPSKRTFGIKVVHNFKRVCMGMPGVDPMQTKRRGVGLKAKMYRYDSAGDGMTLHGWDGIQKASIHPTTIGSQLIEF